MGKGSYNGGSTIIYIRQPSEITETVSKAIPGNKYLHKKYLCKVCNAYIEYKKYFNHLKDEHNLKGCIYCGEPYKDEGKYSHVCPKCGNRILIRLRPKKLWKYPTKNKKKRYKKNKRSLRKNRKKYPY